MIPISEIMARMIAWPGNTRHDIEHLVKVWAYARTIGQREGLDEAALYALEAAAIVHDIACPALRERTGSCNGKLQEQEGAPMAAAFLEELGLEPQIVERVRFLVAHHHTFTGVDGLDWQILLEADYLVNANESGYSDEAIRNFAHNICKTAAGRELFAAIYHVQEA